MTHTCICGKAFEGRRDALYCSSPCRTRASKIARQAVALGPEVPPDWKRCGKCARWKPLVEYFWLNGKRKRYQSYCKPCQRQALNDHRRTSRGLPADAVLRVGPEPKPEGYCYTHKRGRYVMEKRVGHHRADQYGYVPQHILVAEEKYGIAITDDFTVHHKNRRRGDNHPDNLELRLGAHGKGGDVLDTLLADGDIQVAAAAILRRYGWTIAPPLMAAV